MLNNTSNDTTPDTSAGLSARAVRLARRNMCKNTDEDRPGDASATSPASPPNAYTPSPVDLNPFIKWFTQTPGSPPIIRTKLTSPSPLVVGFKNNDECIQERYNSAIQNGDVIVLEGSPVASTAVVDGQKTFTWTDGRKYVGAWKNDNMHGEGTYTWPNGEKYIGAWKNDNMHGEGTHTWADGGKYVGTWKDGNMHGEGTYTWANGNKYVGAYKDGKKYGQGTYTWADGRKYVGAWKDGNMTHME